VVACARFCNQRTGCLSRNLKSPIDVSDNGEPWVIKIAIHASRTKNGAEGEIQWVLGLPLTPRDGDWRFLARLRQFSGIGRRAAMTMAEHADPDG
ncbi:hypothetical protein ASPBRDRAFT_137562, partial [Aspergillus brasiliensis CBS 101740]